MQLAQEMKASQLAGRFAGRAGFGMAATTARTTTSEITNTTAHLIGLTWGRRRWKGHSQLAQSL